MPFTQRHAFPTLTPVPPFFFFCTVSPRSSTKIARGSIGTSLLTTGLDGTAFCRVAMTCSDRQGAAGAQGWGWRASPSWTTAALMFQPGLPQHGSPPGRWIDSEHRPPTSAAQTRVKKKNPVTCERASCAAARGNARKGNPLPAATPSSLGCPP